MIECKLRPRPEFGTVLKSYKSNKKKLGRYHSSYFHDVSGYGKSKWIVLAEIDIIDKKDKITLELHRIFKSVAYQKKKDKEKTNSFIWQFRTLSKLL